MENSVAKKSFYRNHPYLVLTFGAILFSFLVRSWVVFFCLFFTAIIIAYFQDKAEKNKAHMKLLRQDAQNYVDLIKKNKSLSVIPGIGLPIFLNQNENLFLKENVKLFETRAVRHSGGGFAGVRVMKGVTVGGYSGQSESSQEWRLLDSGEIFITNEKILYKGIKENRTIPLEKILAVDTLKDSIRVSVDGRVKSIKFSVSNPYISSTLINILKSVKNPLSLGDLKSDVTFA